MSKTNNEKATLRSDSLPKSEKVLTVVPQPSGVAVKLAALQNSSLTGDDRRIQNVVPSGAKHPTFVPLDK